MTKVHKHSSGNFFSPNARFFGYIFIFFSVGLIFWTFYPEYNGYSKVVIAFLFLPLSLYLTFTTYGVEVDYKNKTTQDYKKLMGFITRKGKFKTIKYNYVTVLPLLRSYSMHTRANMGTSVAESLFSVSLISDNFRKKVEVLTTGNKEEAFRIAQEIASDLELEFIEYNPREKRK